MYSEKSAPWLYANVRSHTLENTCDTILPAIYLAFIYSQGVGNICSSAFVSVSAVDSLQNMIVTMITTMGGTEL